MEEGEEGSTAGSVGKDGGGEGRKHGGERGEGRRKGKKKGWSGREGDESVIGESVIAFKIFVLTPQVRDARHRLKGRPRRKGPPRKEGWVGGWVEGGLTCLIDVSQLAALYSTSSGWLIATAEHVIIVA